MIHYYNITYYLYHQLTISLALRQNTWISSLSTSEIFIMLKIYKHDIL